MRPSVSAAVFLLALCNLVGCSGFGGEWLEEGVMGTNGRLESTTGVRRLALQFNPPAGVQYGQYSERMSVVDARTVESDLYFLYRGSKIAQFGELIARKEGDHLMVTLGSGDVVRFNRVAGKSIFPPRVRLEAILADAADKDDNSQTPASDDKRHEILASDSAP